MSLMNPFAFRTTWSVSVKVWCYPGRAAIKKGASVNLNDSMRGFFEPRMLIQRHRTIDQRTSQKLDNTTYSYIFIYDPTCRLLAVLTNLLFFLNRDEVVFSRLHQTSVDVGEVLLPAADEVEYEFGMLAFFSWRKLGAFNVAKEKSVSLPRYTISS